MLSSSRLLSTKLSRGIFPSSKFMDNLRKTGGRNLNRTLSVLDREFHELRNANEKVVTLDQG